MIFRDSTLEQFKTKQKEWTGEQNNLSKDDKPVIQALQWRIFLLWEMLER